VANISEVDASWPWCLETVAKALSSQQAECSQNISKQWDMTHPFMCAKMRQVLLCSTVIYCHDSPNLLKPSLIAWPLGIAIRTTPPQFPLSSGLPLWDLVAISNPVCVCNAINTLMSIIYYVSCNLYMYYIVLYEYIIYIYRYRSMVCGHRTQCKSIKLFGRWAACW
jgi:hypothetical protein